MQLSSQATTKTLLTSTNSEAPEEVKMEISLKRIDKLGFFVNPRTGSRRNGTPYFHRTDNGKMLYEVVSNETIPELFKKAIEQGRIYVPAHIVESRQTES